MACTSKQNRGVEREPGESTTEREASRSETAQTKIYFFKRCFNTYPIDATAPPDGKEDDTGIHIKSMYL